MADEHYHVVSWAPDGSRPAHLMVDSLERAVEAVRKLATAPEARPGAEADWVGETFDVRQYTRCRPWVQILAGGTAGTVEEHDARRRRDLRGLHTAGEMAAVLNEGPRPSTQRRP